MDLSQKLQKDTIHSFIIKIPVAILAFTYIVILTRLLGAAGTGSYSYITTSLIFLSTILGFNFRQSVAFFVASKKISLPKIVTISTAFIIVILAIFIIGSLILFNSSDTLISIILPQKLQIEAIVSFAIVYFVVHLIMMVFEGIMVGLTEFKKMNYVELYSHITKVAIFLLIYIYQLLNNIEYSIAFIFYGLLCIEIINLLFYLPPFLKVVRLKFDFSSSYRSDLKALKRYGLQGYFTQNAAFLIKRVDVWFVEFYNGLSALGNYSLATQTTNFLMEFIFPIQKVLLPYLIKMDRKEGQRIFYLTCSFSFLFMLICAVIIFCLSDYFIPFIFGDEFYQAIIPVKILSFAIVIVLIRNFLKLFNSIYDRQKYTVYSSSMELVLIVCLDIVLIPKYGIVGAAYATLCSYIFSTSYLIYSAFGELMYPIIGLFIPKLEDFHLLKKEITKLVYNYRKS